MDMTVMNRWVATAGACLVLWGLSGCTTNQTTGRTQLNVLSRDEEVALGATEGPKLTQEFGGEVQNPLLRGYIDEVGQKLKNQTEGDGPTRTWTYTLLESDVINAFALPGEKVFISRALADKLTTEAQLAGVLGHETGHVMARHTSERLGQAQIGQGLLTVGGLFAGSSTQGQIGMQAGQLLVGGTLLSFSRGQESEADSLGMRYMTKAGYNPKGQLQVMEVLKAASGSGGTPEWLSTHPAPTTRIADVKKALETTYAYTQSGPQAGNFQDFADRYRQRYLSIRDLEPKAPAKAKKTAAVDEHGRTRLLATVDLDDPTTWCAVCRANAELAGR
jgi:predicted Zn-dependent protease